MENITLRVKVGDVEELAPFIFDESLELGRVNTQVLILKHFLSMNVDQDLYVGQNNCTKKISWQEGPYFDKKTKFVLYKYQTQPSVREDIISHIMSNLIETEPSISEAELEAARIFDSELGTMSKSTIAVMHGYHTVWSTAEEYQATGIIEPTFLNKTYTTENKYISQDPDAAPPSPLYTSTEEVLNLINDAAEGNYSSFDQVRSAVEDQSKETEEASERRSLDYFQRPDPNIVGLDDILSGNIDSVFDLDANRIGLFIPSAENPEDSYTLASPPQFTEQDWSTHEVAASKRALREVMRQLYEVDIADESLFSVRLTNDVYQGLFPNLHEHTVLTGPMLTYESLIIPSDENSPIKLSFTSENIDQFYEYLVKFLDKVGSDPAADPLIKYKGLTTL